MNAEFIIFLVLALFVAVFSVMTVTTKPLEIADAMEWMLTPLKLFKVNAKYHPGTSTTTILITLSVQSRESLDKYLQLLSGIKSVYQVDRLMH